MSAQVHQTDQGTLVRRELAMRAGPSAQSGPCAAIRTAHGPPFRQKRARTRALSVLRKRGGRRHPRLSGAQRSAVRFPRRSRRMVGRAVFRAENSAGAELLEAIQAARRVQRAGGDVGLWRQDPSSAARACLGKGGRHALRAMTQRSSRCAHSR